MNHDQIANAQRDDPSLTPSQLIADYEAGPELLRAAVAGMTGEELRRRPVKGKWSTLEVACHVCDSEQFFADRVKRTLALDRPLLVAADPQPYPEAVCYHDRDIEEELALVELTRRQVARVLKLVPTEAWQRRERPKIIWSFRWDSPRPNDIVPLGQYFSWSEIDQCLFRLQDFPF